MKIALIAAVARNGCIGREGALPWHLPEDFRYFKRVTLGKPLIMGRRTFESIGKPLPGRHNIVLSRSGAVPEGCSGASSLDAALAAAGDGACGDAEECMVIGGAAVYALALPRAQRLYLTEIDAAFDGDTFFPSWDRAAWREVERVPGATDDPPFSFVRYERAADGGVE